MMPFSSLFSNQAQGTTPAHSSLKATSRKERTNSIGNKRNGKKNKSNLKPREYRGSGTNVGIIGEHISSAYTGPEEEMFTINMESPVKSQVNLNRSEEWPLLQSSVRDDKNNVIKHDVRPGKKNIMADGGKTSDVSTPEDMKSENVMKAGAVIQAPKKQKNRGRAEQLTRYIHKYECEDLMEYAVDIYHWKLSLEPDYRVGNWQYTQYEITPYMRYSLLDWLVSVTRTLDFSLETWCLAVNYLDRFLCCQLVGKDCLQLLGMTALWLGAKQEELLPPSLDHLVALCGDTFSALNFQHMELVLLAKLQFRLAAPTPAYHLSHLISVEEEKDWSEDLSRHMVETIMEDHILARESPSKIAHAVYNAIKSFDTSTVQILESSCPRCEPLTADMWTEELFQVCLHRVIEILSS